MGLSQGYTWYAKYIAEAAYQNLPNTNSTPDVIQLPLEINRSSQGGCVLIVESSIATVILALVTLTASTVTSIIFTQIAKALAVLWCSLHTGPPKATEASQVLTPNATFHIPIILANAGLWTTDAWASMNLFWQCMQHRNLVASLLYAGVVILCLLGLSTGTLAAFMVSRDVDTGFGQTLPGPCIPPTNFSLGAINATSLGEDDHGRAVELLPWIGSFTYSWSKSGGDKYNTREPVIDPISHAKYSQLDYCLLGDNALCNSDFNRTHVVTANLTGPQLGLWSGGDYNIALEANCMRLNSTTISYRSKTFPYWRYAFAAAPGATNISATATYLEFGLAETERYARKKNFIADSFFVNNNGDRDFNWALEWFPQSLRALDTASLTVITVLPSIESINQQPGDELYLLPVSASEFQFAPDQVAHLLCWENTFISTHSSKTRLTTSRILGNFTETLRELSLPALLNPLLFYFTDEFVLKPAHYLRGNTLLQSMADTPKGEYNATYAPPVLFGAEMHRWGHIGTLDLASKATRMATGYYARGNNVNSSVLSALHTDPNLLDLCNAIRQTRAGAISIPIRDLAVLFTLLVLAVITWITETVLVAFAQKGWAGFIRLWLILPAAKPTSLNASVAIAVQNRNVKNSASGWPLVYMKGPAEYPGPMIGETMEGKSTLKWGPKKLSTEKKVKFA